MKKWMSVMAATLAITMLPVGVCANAYETADLKVTVDGLLRPMDTQPVIVENTTMVGIRALSELLNASVTWDEKTNKVTVKMPGYLMILTPYEKEAMFNYEKVEMPVAPVVVEQRVMVPLRFVSEKFRLAVDWQEEKNLIALSTGKKPYSVLESMPQTEATTVLTFEQALKLINDRDGKLIDMKNSLVLLKRKKEALDDYVYDNIAHLHFNFNKVYTLDEIDKLQDQFELDNQLKAMDLQEKQIRNANEQALVAAISALTQSTYTIFQTEQKIKLDELNLKNTELKLSLGMEQETNVTNLVNSIAKSKLSLENQKLTLAENRLNLNNLLGKPANELISVTNKKDVSVELSEQQLQKHLEEQMKSNPSIVAKEIDWENANNAWELYDVRLKKEYQTPKTKDDEDPDNVLQMKNKIESTKRALDDAKSSLDKKIRLSFSNLLQMKESNESLKLDMESAVLAYKVVVANYLAGYATIYDVEKAKMNILNLELSLSQSDIAYQNALDVYMVPTVQSNLTNGNF